MPELASIPVVLKTSMAAQDWELTVPNDVQVQRLIINIVRDTNLGFRERDEKGVRIAYRLMHQEKNCYLTETDTHRKAGVQDNHTLTLLNDGAFVEWPLEMVRVVLKTTSSDDAWALQIPCNLAIFAMMTQVVQTGKLGLCTHDEAGAPL